MTTHLPATTISVPELRTKLSHWCSRATNKLADLQDNVMPMAVLMLALLGLIVPSTPQCLVSLSGAALVLFALIAFPVAAAFLFARMCLAGLEKLCLKKVISSAAERFDTSLRLLVNAFWISALRHWAQLEADLRRRCLSLLGAPAVTLVPRLVPTPSFLRV